MGDHVAVPATVTVRSDAWSRAVRTLWIAFGVDAAIMIGTGLTAMLVDADISSKAFWTGLGILVGKSVLSSLASYLVRLRFASKAEKEREALLPMDSIPVK